MNADLKARWIAALRSGEFHRGQGEFQDGDTFCPLGVLCRISDAPLLDENGSDNYPYVSSVLSESGVDATQVWIRNDFWGWGFEQTADWLEAALRAEGE